LDGVVRDFSVHGGCLNNKTLVACAFNNVDGEVAIVFTGGFFFLLLLLLVFTFLLLLFLWLLFIW